MDSALAAVCIAHSIALCEKDFKSNLLEKRNLREGDEIAIFCGIVIPLALDVICFEAP